MRSSLDDIAMLYARRGQEQYTGEPVSHLEHALQTALLAEQSGANASLITAALLHDMGHLTQELGESPSARGIDDLHQFAALPFLRRVFEDAVVEAICWHVDAKRYLCFSDTDYFNKLSEDSKRSLQLQGGVFDSAQAQAFIAKPFASDAVKLRRWDDQAKTPGLPTPSIEHYLSIAGQCLRS